MYDVHRDEVTERLNGFVKIPLQSTMRLSSGLGDDAHHTVLAVRVVRELVPKVCVADVSELVILSVGGDGFSIVFA